MIIPIAKPLIGEEEKKAVLEVLCSGSLAQGSKVREFEQQFAKFIGVKHAIATANGTTALHAALLAQNIQAGDEVITSPFSFIATANAIRMCGATPVFVDIDEKTFNINPALLESAVTSKSKAIMPVHLFGLPADMEKISTIAKKHHLIIIEDACQAHGAEFQGKKVGSFGTGCFSFYPTKNMTTGEGGMITTNDDSIAQKARKFINHGSERKYYHDCVGYNYRMTDIAAALGLAQLQKLTSFNQQRRKNAAYLQEQLSDIKGLILPQEQEGHVYHQFTLRISSEFGKSRDEVRDLLTKGGIDCAVFYPVPIHQQKAYAEYGSYTFPVAEKAAKEVISLPVHPALTEQDLSKIVLEIRKIAPPQKSLMRTILKNKCSLLSAEEVKAHSKTIGETLCSSSFFQKANSILFYYPRKKEVDLRQAIDDALRQKKKVILPTVRDGSLLCRQIFSLEQDLHDGAYGIKEPREDSPLVDASDIDLVLVPGIAFDGEGNRLGHGGGYYDAFFKKTTALKIGIAFGLQIVKAIPKEAHDVPVDSIITERGIIKK